jgi:hypothetical protein
VVARGGIIGDQPAVRAGSELAIEQRWYPSTAMDDLLEIEGGTINDTRLYRCRDRMLPAQDKAGATS